METLEYHIFGAGGFGREVAQLLHDLGEEHSRFAGFIDDTDFPTSEALVWGPVRSGAELSELAGSNFLVGIGKPSTRLAVTERAIAAGLRSGPAILHPRAWVGRFIEIGDGSIICANASLSTQITIHSHVHVNLNCTIGHDAVLHDYVTMAPGVSVSGFVTIERGVDLGTGAVILPGLTVGEGAVVGAGAVVSKDVEPGVTVVGIPARPLPR